jgi:hypothetical protein
MLADIKQSLIIFQERLERVIDTSTYAMLTSLYAGFE